MAQAGRGLIPADPRPLEMFRRCPCWHMVWGPKFVAHAWFAVHVLIKARASSEFSGFCACDCGLDVAKQMDRYQLRDLGTVILELVSRTQASITG